MSRPLLSIPDEAIRASDAERERALDMLRDHWIAGRLLLDEYEERCDEVTAGRYVGDLRHAIRELPETLPEPGPPPAAVAAPPPPGGALAAAGVGAGALVLATVSVGLLCVVTLPLSVWAWAIGCRARRRGRAPARVAGTIGEVLGIVGTVVALTALLAWAALLGAL